MVGSIPANLHEGSRSEYLAQYVFASFGTAISVPHHEDSGIDLYCTITERKGQRAWPMAYFSVQVKSTPDPWVFDSEESVNWLIKYPAPLFLCIVEKASARLRVYHTSLRFYLWSLPPLPRCVRLTPGTGTQGTCTQWEDGKEFSLSAPILECSIQDLLNDDFHQNAKRVLKLWIDIDLSNLRRVASGIHLFKMPHRYQTNETQTHAEVTQGITRAQNIDQALDHLKESLLWITDQYYSSDNVEAAVRGVMLWRYLFPGSNADFGLQTLSINTRLNGMLGLGDYQYAGVDSLNEMVTEKLKATGQSTAASS